MPKYLSLLLCFLLLHNAQAQQADRPLPVGSFGKDSVKIGEIISYSLSYHYPSAMEIVFPDSMDDFASFEFVDKVYYPTRSDTGFSLDSAVYLLRTFDVQQVQRLALPVSLLAGGDTAQIMPAPDSVWLQEMVHEVADPLPLQSDTSLLPIRRRFNYPYLLIGLGAVAAILLLIWWIFGAGIRTNYTLYKLKNDHAQFLSRYNAHADRFRRTETLSNMEKAVSLWKNYLTRLEDKAVNSFTTREIADFYDENEDVSMALKLCDRAIYGNIITNEASESNRALILLQTFAIQRYHTIRETTRNAAATRRNI